MTTLESITRAALSAINGGAQGTQATQSSVVRTVCNRQQFDWMASHMVPDGALRPGVQRHVIARDAQMCGFPMPR